MKIEKIIIIIIASILILYSYEVNAAEEFSYTNANWAFHECNWNGTETSNCKWTSTAAIGTNIYRDTDFYINGFRINLNYSGTTLVAGNSYTLTFNMAVSTPHYFANLGSQFAFVETRESCIGATSSATDCLYENFTSFSIKPSYSGSGNVVKFTINFVPSQNSNYVKIFLIQTNDAYNMLRANDIDLIQETNYGRIGSINGTYVSGTSAIIENQTNVIIQGNTEINNNLNEIENAITGEHEYENNPSEEIEGKNEIDEMKELEENILGNLDFSGTENLNITINPNTSRFIWDIVEQLRGINSKIVMLITSILGLGIIKMILNR